MRTPALASRTQRLIGQLVDGLVGAAPLVAGAVISAGSEGLGVALMFGGMAWSFFYYFLADGLPGGQSLGKRWLGMRVISEASGRACTFRQSLVRNFLLALLGPIDWVFIFGERHQRLGDKAAGTIVVVA